MAKRLKEEEELVAVGKEHKRNGNHSRSARGRFEGSLGRTEVVHQDISLMSKGRRGLRRSF